MYHSILVPLDGSPFGEHALPMALSLARRAGAQLHLAHVHASPRLGSAPAADQARWDGERLYFERLEQRLRASGDVPVTTMLLSGPVVQALREYAMVAEIDLIVMTTHGRGTLSSAWIGSIPDTLMRCVSQPVLLVRPEGPRPDLLRAPAVKHVLLPLDGSALAEQMLAYATELCRLMEAECTLLQAVEPLFTAYWPELPAIVADEQAQEQLRAQGQAYLDHVAAQLRARGLRVRTATVVEQAATAVLDYARDHEVDLIALETHGYSGLVRWIVGGVADKVIRGAGVPVLLHRPPGGSEWTHEEMSGWRHAARRYSAEHKD